MTGEGYAFVAAFVAVFAGATVWWVSIERQRDAASERSHAALEDGNYTDAGRAMTEYARLTYRQRWASWLARLSCLGLGVFLGTYFGHGGSW